MCGTLETIVEGEGSQKNFFFSSYIVRLSQEAIYFIKLSYFVAAFDKKFCKNSLKVTANLFPINYIPSAQDRFRLQLLGYNFTTKRTCLSQLILHLDCHKLITAILQAVRYYLSGVFLYCFINTRQKVG